MENRFTGQSTLLAADIFQKPREYKAEMGSMREILDCIDQGGVVVTANSRASRNLRRAYADRQKSRGVDAWTSPGISDWASWLASLWDEHAFINADAPMVLSPLQERSLWRHVLQAQPEARLVYSLEPLAKLAQNAYSLLSEYGAHSQRKHPWSNRGEDSVSDPEAFRRWASAFDVACQRLSAISHSELARSVTSAITSDVVAVPDQMMLVGFDRLTPAQSTLVDALREKGCVVARADLQEASGQMKLIVARNRRDEIATCAAWLRRMLLTNPNQRIAVIVPDVQSARGEIERTFRRILSPESMDITSKSSTLPFEFSLGTPVAMVPAARAALLLLSWLERPLLAEEISWLLLSGFVAATDTDRIGLCKVDACIRNSGLMQKEISLIAFLNQRRSLDTRAGQQLALRLSNFQKISLGKAHRDALQWAELAHAMLNAVGWPGMIQADSVEFQAREKWSELLDSMATLGFDNDLLTYGEFVSALETAADEAIFAPESHDAQVQILGAAESSGQTFDALWFLGADESSWPLFGRAHPLLPLAVQRAALMPHSTDASDWALARAATLRLSASAPVVCFSYSLQNADGVLRPSALLQELPALSGAQTAIDFQGEMELEEPTPRWDRTVRIQDSDDIPWPRELSPGGFAVLRRQSACPFQSFAARRLLAGELGEAQWGLSALQRGELLHLVLQHLWSPTAAMPARLHSLEDLLDAIRDGQLGDMLSRHIEDVFRNHSSTQGDDAWSYAYLEAEKVRLHSLLTAWLQYESERMPFTVEACEKSLNDVYVGELRLDLRVDRVDLVAANARILLDYKTGQVKSSSWNAPRIEEPQLPLYATYGGLENVQGLLFAQVRAGDTTFVGHVQHVQSQLFSTPGGKSKRIAVPLDRWMLSDWKDDLLTLSAAFLNGEASVSPKKYPDTCKYCAFPALCRVAETEVANDALDATYTENGIDIENDLDESND